MLPYSRVLVVVPHSDDEVLLAAGIIKRCILEGKQVQVAIVTNGDYLATTSLKGEVRLLESIDALTFLGMKEQDIYFLGYPDTGMEAEVSFLNRILTDKEGKQRISSSFTSQTYGIGVRKSDYHYKNHNQHAPYTREAFEQDLHELIMECDPQLVITTSQLDCHGDHSALYAFVCKELKKQEKSGKIRILWEGLVHSMDGDESWPLPGEYFTKPSAWDNQQILDWESRIQVELPLCMTQGERSEHEKFRAIKKYRSALDPKEPQVIEYLLSFAKKEEIFWEATIC